MAPVLKIRNGRNPKEECMKVIFHHQNPTELNAKVLEICSAFVIRSGD